MAILNKTLAVIQKHVAQSQSILSKLEHAGAEGARLAPARNNRTDAHIGGRLDWGKSYIRDGKLYQNVNFQLNSAANDSSIKQLVKTNGAHKKYAEAAVLVGKPEVPVEKVENGKKVKLSEEEIKAAKKEVLKERRDKLMDDLEVALSSEGKR